MRVFRLISSSLVVVLLLTFSLYAQVPNTNAGKLSILVRNSDAIIVGRVLNIQPDFQDDERSNSRFSAEIMVLKRIKNNPRDRVQVIYESDTESPKPRLHHDQIAVFILDKSSGLNDKYFMFHPLQIQPKKSLPLIKNILRKKNHHAIQKQSKDEKLLQQLVRDSDLVVVGEVTMITVDIGDISDEHNPRWEVATLEINQVLKCKLPNCGKQLIQSQNRVEIKFAGSQSPAWRDDPKLKLGQKGVFILFDRDKKLNKGYLSLYSDLQVQSLENLIRIQKWLKSPK